MVLLKIVFLLTILSTGLIGGFFYAYSYSVNAGLGRLGDGAYLRAMQSINRTVLNPVFFLTFIGTLILLPVATWLEFRLMGATVTCYGLLGSSLLYFFGVFVVTARGNVPLNDALEQIDLDAASPELIRQQRQAFERPWNRYHRIRTLANVVAFLVAIWAALQAGA